MVVLTNSRLRVFRECARKHDLSYNQGWRPVRDAEPLRFGTLMHRGLAAFWNNASLAEILSISSDDPYETAKFAELMTGYYNCYAVARGATYDVLGVEEVFDAPLLNPETMAASKTWRLGGKLDVMLNVRATNRTALMEHKTTSEPLTSADYWALLQIDHQISHYIIGAESLGYTVDDVIYDVVHKPGRRPLQINTRRSEPESPEAYALRIREDIAADPSKYYQQRIVPRLNSQLKDFLFDAWQTAATIRESARAGRAPRNPEACLRYGRCWAWDICTNGVKPEEHLEAYRKLEDVNPELG